MEQPTEPMSRLEQAVAEICTARTNVDRERTAARRGMAAITEPADRFAMGCYVSALGVALDRLDVCLAMVTDQLPGAGDQITDPPELYDCQITDLGGGHSYDPSVETWRELLGRINR